MFDVFFVFFGGDFLFVAKYVRCHDYAWIRVDAETVLILFFVQR